MSNPTIRCNWCGRERNCMLHLRADHPPTAAKAWLKRTCKEEKVHDNRVCSGCSGHRVKPCEFTYRAGLGGAS